jgi:glutaredoxin 3
MKGVRMYSTQTCPFCVMARRLLSSKGVQVDEIAVDGRPECREEMTRVTGRYTVPQIFVGDVHVGGCEDLYALDRCGRLDSLLKD